jgi:serine protease Do
MRRRRESPIQEKAMQANTFKRSLIALALAGAFVTGAVLADRVGVKAAHATASAVNAAAVAAPAPGAATALPDFADLVARQGPAVVQISVSQNAEKVAARNGRGMPDIANIFPGFRNFPRPQMPDESPTHGVGSGFIASADGIILTNAHVVADADEVTVRLTDKREFKAKVLGSDRMTDVAVLKIDARGLPAVKIGDPQSTRVGEWVVAIGTPFGLDNTVTSGIVSAKSRSLPGDAAVPFIQTDAAVNPGNSGGPLFNLKGEVIGINSQIFSRSGGFQGLAFAIPIDVAMNVKDQIQQHGKAEHGRLGVTIQEVSPALAENFSLKQAEGALVGAVQKDSAAAKAGIEPGDVILKMNGKAIGRSNDLPPLVAAVKPGSNITLEVWHEGKAKDVTVTVGSFEDKTTLASATGNATGGKLGVAVRALSPEERKASELQGGVVVEHVAGAAARAGVRPGDVIVSVNRTPVKSPEQLRELIGKAGKTVALLVQRDDARIFIPVTIG